MKYLLILLVLIIASCAIKPVETIDQYDQINCPQLIALDSIAEQYMSDGWTCDASYLIAGFEVDLYDESDTAEYKLYCAYMED